MRQLDDGVEGADRIERRVRKGESKHICSTQFILVLPVVERDPSFLEVLPGQVELCRRDVGGHKLADALC